jgi:hypothetical protein
MFGTVVFEMAKVPDLSAVGFASSQNQPNSNERFDSFLSERLVLPILSAS